MSLFPKKGPFDLDNDGLSRQNKPRKPVSRDTRRTALLLLGNTVLSLLIYFGCVGVGFEYIMFIYLGVATVLFLIYIIYNQGFVYKGVTREMLADTLTPEQKTAILEKAAARMSASRWMLTLIIPLVVTIAVDITYLYCIKPLISNLL